MTSARRTMPLLAVIISLLALAPLAQAQSAPSPPPTLQTPDGRALYQWNPSESWPGGAQHDPRLDRPVQFWRAGLALSEVFDSVAEQTGVELAFWPQGDENARVRVTLYLNRESPPSLRALMAQLAWVTDCAFAYTQADAGEPDLTYYLLSTSIGQAVPLAPAVLEERSEQRARAGVDPSSYPTHSEEKAVVKASLEQLRRSLALPREELIARYKGVDDYLLLTLTDPRRRAAAEYVCGAIGEGFEPPPHYEEWSKRRWSDLSEDERALVSLAKQFRESERDLLNSVEVEVWVEFRRDSLLLSVAALTQPPGGWLGMGYPRWLARTPERGMQELQQLHSSDITNFLRSIGEDIAEDREQADVDRWRTSISRQRRELELSSLARHAVSPEAAGLLASLDLLLDAGRPYAIWEIQEMVAVASGLNVVSDCFWQPARPLHDTQSALIALASAARAWSKQATELHEVEWMAGWEWGDAGSFLRFRSIDRDIWRASILPDDVLGQVDEYLSPYLPELAQPDWPRAGFSLQLTPDPLALVRIGNSLDDLQLSYGGRLLYEDPTEPTAACRYALRSSFLGCILNTFGHRPSDALNATRALEAFRLIASLSEQQWALARTPDGLPGDQLTPEQLDRASRAVAFWDVYEGRTSVLRLRGADYVSDSPRHAGRSLWFYVTLVEPKEAQNWGEDMPQEHKRDLNLFHWQCNYRLDVPVPRPLSLLRPVAESPL